MWFLSVVGVGQLLCFSLSLYIYIAPSLSLSFTSFAFCAFSFSFCLCVVFLSFDKLETCGDCVGVVCVRLCVRTSVRSAVYISQSRTEIESEPQRVTHMHTHFRRLRSSFESLRSRRLWRCVRVCVTILILYLHVLTFIFTHTQTGIRTGGLAGPKDSTVQPSTKAQNDSLHGLTSTRDCKERAGWWVGAACWDYPTNWAANVSSANQKACRSKRVAYKFL